MTNEPSCVLGMESIVQHQNFTEKYPPGHEKDSPKNQIPFSLPIFISVML